MHTETSDPCTLEPESSMASAWAGPAAPEPAAGAKGELPTSVTCPNPAAAPAAEASAAMHRLRIADEMLDSGLLIKGATREGIGEDTSTLPSSPPGFDNLADGFRQRLGDFPLGVVSADLTQVGGVADVVADPVLVHVRVHLRLAGERFRGLERLEDRGAGGLAAPEVVDLRGAGRPDERGDEPRDIERVDVVADLLPLVSQDLVFAALEVALDQVAQEPVELYARVVRPGQAASAQAARGHAEIATVFLDHHVGRGLRGAE